MSVAALGVLLLAAPAASAPYLQLSALGPDGAESPARAAAISRALVIACATVVVGADSRQKCEAGCVQVTVREGPLGRFVIEASQGRHQASTVVEIPTTAPPFEQARTIALRTRQLIAWDIDPPSAPKAPPRGPPSLAPLPQPPPDAVPPLAPPPAPPPEATEEPPAPPVVEKPSPAPPALLEPRDAPLKPRPQYLWLDVAATVLGGRASPDFLTGGLQVLFRARMSRFFEAQASYAILYGPSGVDARGPFVQTPSPGSVVVALKMPFHPSLAIGLGAEQVLIYLTHPTEMSTDNTEFRWSIGAISRLSYRYQGPSWSLVGAASASVQPLQGSFGESMQRYRYPLWTFAASAGFGFVLF
ncbi:MAG: hypothetical protein HY901_23620 [Deltaproteobacteria bacterium]|nr:hypothetical protein [Deltaproteobacteria bacterium]